MNVSVPSKVNITWKEKNHQKSQKLVKEEKEKAKKIEKDNFQIKNVAVKKIVKLEEAEKDKQRRPQRKAIGFSGVQEEAKALTDNKSFHKMKSAKTIKSRKEITWDDL